LSAAAVPEPAIVPADTLSIDELAALFGAAYEGYYVPLHVDAAAMRLMIAAFDLDPRESRVVRAAGVPVAVAMLGLRDRAAWIGGMGVVPGERGRGLGVAVMNAVIARARARGARELWLEVLEQNAPAARIYERLGFVRTRGLGVWSIECPAGGAEGATPCSVDAARARVRAHRAAREPWQRADGTLERMLAGDVALRAVRAAGDAAAGGAAVYRVAGDRASVLQLAVAPGREHELVPALLAGMCRDAGLAGCRWVNLPDEDPAAPVMASVGARLDARQHEMRLRLD